MREYGPTTPRDILTNARYNRQQRLRELGHKIKGLVMEENRLVEEIDLLEAQIATMKEEERKND